MKNKDRFVRNALKSNMRLIFAIILFMDWDLETKNRLLV